MSAEPGDIEAFYESLGWGPSHPYRASDHLDLSASSFARCGERERLDAFYAGCALFARGRLDESAIAALCEWLLKLACEPTPHTPDGRLKLVGSFIDFVASRSRTEAIARLRAFDRATSTHEERLWFAHEFATRYLSDRSDPAVVERTPDLVSLLRENDPYVTCAVAASGVSLTAFLDHGAALAAARVAIDHQEFSSWDFGGLVETLDAIGSDASTDVLVHMADRILSTAPSALDRKRWLADFTSHLIGVLRRRTVEPGVLHALVALQAEVCPRRHSG